MTLDLDVDSLRVSLELRDQLIQSRFGLVRQLFLAELEVALVFAQGHLVDQPARRRDDLVEPPANLAGAVARLGSAFAYPRAMALRCAASAAVWAPAAALPADSAF